MKEIKNCIHEWTDYYDAGFCPTPYCSWHEKHCRKCGIYEVICGCGFFNSNYNKIPMKVILRNEKKKFKKQENIHEKNRRNKNIGAWRYNG